MKNSATIFRSLEPAPYFEAAEALRSAKIPFQGWDSQEGSVRFPRTMHMIAVSSENEASARRVIAHIPSEIIHSPTPSTSSQIDPRTLRLQILAVIIFLLVAIYQSFF
jgi:hypothetical protein